MLSSYKQWTVDWDIEAQMFDDSVDVATSWERFKAAYLQRCTSMLAVEMNFMGFMEDERKREGRIFTRWVELTISMADLYNNPTAQDASGGRSRASSARTGSARTGNHSGKHASAVIDGKNIAKPFHIQKNPHSKFSTLAILSIVDVLMKFQESDVP